MKTILYFFLLPFLAVSQSSKKDFRQLLKTFAGTYHADITPSDPTAIVGIEATPVKLSFVKEPVFYVKWIRANGKVYRQRLYVFKYNKATKTISSEAMSFKTDLLFYDFYKSTQKVNTLTQNDLKTTLGCPDIWQHTNSQFIGSVDSCKFNSERRGKPIFISGRLKVDANGWASTEVGKDENGKVLFGKIDDYALQIKRVK
jgi:CpeT/CpcT family (DUF1001)